MQKLILLIIWRLCFCCRFQIFIFAGLKADLDKGNVVELVNTCLSFVEDIEHCVAKVTGAPIESRLIKLIHTFPLQERYWLGEGE